MCAVRLRAVNSLFWSAFASALHVGLVVFSTSVAANSQMQQAHADSRLGMDRIAGVHRC